MDAPLTSDALIRPWRRATIAASLLAAVELVALLACAFLLLAKPLSHAIEHRATTTALAPAKKKAAAPVVHHLVKPPTVGVAKLTRKQTTILVLNGNGRAGAAHVSASQLQHLGYTISAASNAPRSDYATTVVMFRPGYAAEAQRLAHDVHASVVGPLDGIAVSSLHGAKLVFILGA